MGLAYLGIAAGCVALVLIVRAAAITGARVVVRSLRAGATAHKAARGAGR
jgi:hypothetical protein